ncbi:MAG: NapC/NirT family cytochrome c [Planctomycetota bacterium]|jgi:hypothetical protein
MIAVSKIATFGAALTTSAILGDLIMILGELFLFESNPYMGIFTYLLMPGLMVMGLMLIPLGVGLRLRKAHAGFSLAAIEELAQRRRIGVPHVFQVVFTLSMVNLVIFGIIGYRGFHYTESTEFCGELCHEVMHPEFMAYSRSPHSQINCVHCHIGPGAGWFVKSKLSGARQVLAVLRDSYSRPIETPVHNLRPAREVCEVCHRPEIFHGNLLKVVQHFEPDRDNTRTYTVLNLRVGGGDEQGRDAHGIHWHVSKKHQVRYYATDRERENIVWIELLHEDGTRRVWTNPNDPIEPPGDAELRTMDCVDCHNRPTHIFLPPEQALDEWMMTDQIDPEIPWIRKAAMEVLTRPYETTEMAMEGIAELPELYRQQYPEEWEQHEQAVRETVPALQEIHRLFVYPEMNIQWNTYNSLIGHPTSHTLACFRCHNGVLRDQAGETITLDCDSCHHILANRETDPRVLKNLVAR